MDGPKVTIDMVAEKEISISEGGQTRTTRVATTTIEPGGLLYYTLKLANKGNQPATNVVVNNAIPDGTTYVPRSATGPFSTVLISTDHGELFGAETTGTLPETVTNIRWIVDDIPAGRQRKLEYQVRASDKQAFGVARAWAALYFWLLNAFSR